jgi:hypothetical protein
MRALLALLSVSALGLPCAGLGSSSPDEVARAYFEAATAGDQQAVKDLVEPRCHEHKIGRGGPVVVMGMAIAVEDLEVTLAQQEGDTAAVAYKFSGSIDKESTTLSGEVFGAEIEVSTGPLSVDISEVSGTLHMVRIDGSWKVSCPGG